MTEKLIVVWTFPYSTLVVAVVDLHTEPDHLLQLQMSPHKNGYRPCSCDRRQVTITHSDIHDTNRCIPVKQHVVLNCSRVKYLCFLAMQAHVNEPTHVSAPKDQPRLNRRLTTLSERFSHE